MNLLRKIPRFLFRPVRIAVDAVGQFFRTDSPTRAAGLTLYSFLAIIPIVCCVLVVAKVCGVDRYAREQIDRRLDVALSQFESVSDGKTAVGAPADGAPEAGRPAKTECAEGDDEREAPELDSEDKRRIAMAEFATEARKVSNEVFARIDRFDLRTFGWIGFALLLWTVVSTLSVVEESFNRIWDVPKARPLWRRILLYIFLIVLLPVLVFLVMSIPVIRGITALFGMTDGSVSWMLVVSRSLGAFFGHWFMRAVLSTALTAIVFGFFYWILPNRRIRISFALGGGFVAAVALSAWMRLCVYAQIGIAKASALYGGFAALPIILAWQHVSWQIVLFVACLVRAGDRAFPAKADRPDVQQEVAS